MKIRGVAGKQARTPNNRLPDIGRMAKVGGYFQRARAAGGRARRRRTRARRGYVAIGGLVRT
ncbi:hypothetical protein EDWATA_01161 [Edwardsiella tarda ATCC 23685]|uniref:Uncharacterized protein n=1 Tax=Edwardsiella tarda ATCC 23685 TaxID=500638 RepID=D4F359_EDWTA|nr:hypothetical protein EDWATA_01161 [Edwardsiella tarda ATCC 23685]